MYKIKYKLNLLPQVGIHAIVVDEDGQKKQCFVNEGISIMDMCINYEDIDIYLSRAVQQVIHFKWNKFAKKFHMIGCCSHIFYMLVLVVYTNLVYINNRGVDLDAIAKIKKQGGQVPESSQSNSYSILLAIGTFYPTIYDLNQMYRLGLRDYFSDAWNYIDLLQLISSITQVIIHSLWDPMIVPCKFTMMVVMFLGIFKLFFFLRIFDALSPIVTMLGQVVNDLTPFMGFYFILIIMFSMQLSILGLGNLDVKGKFRDAFHKKKYTHQDSDYIGEEYRWIGLFWGNFFQVFRASMGDYMIISQSLYLNTQTENIAFWIIFFFILLTNNIIFLNFVIAEASNSYSIVNEKLVQYILKEKSKLIDEAEDLVISMQANTCNNTARPRGSLCADHTQLQLYPKYIVIREVAQ